MGLQGVNWFGIAGGVVTLIVLGVSLFVPWWQLTIGENMMTVNASPVNTNFGLMGVQFTIPLIWALNVSSILTFTLSGLLMLVYSLYPHRSFSEHLLSFSYKKPLLSLIFFLAGLLIITSAAGLMRVNVPLLGSAAMSLPSNFTMGANITASVAGNFLVPFWLAMVAAGLCIAARLYHPKIARKIPPPPPPPTAYR
jgi:hypothetical protein